MWYFILYVLIAMIGIAIVCRLSKDGIINDRPYYDLSDKDVAIIACCSWVLAVPIFIIVFVLKFIYKGIYYVVDKIYTKIVSIGKRAKEKRTKESERFNNIGHRMD